MKRFPLYIIEGAWDKPHEAPQVLPFFEAYANTFRDIDLNHRTFRSAEDIKYYVSRLPTNGRAFLYVACHGEVGALIPADGRSKISNDQVKEALSAHKPNSIGFVHFGCCSFVTAKAMARRPSLENLKKASGAHWVSGYTRDVDWPTRSPDTHRTMDGSATTTANNSGHPQFRLFPRPCSEICR